MVSLENCLSLGCRPIDLGLQGGKGISSSRRKWRVLTFENHGSAPGRKGEINSVWMGVSVVGAEARTAPSITWIRRSPQGLHPLHQAQIVFGWTVYFLRSTDRSPDIYWKRNCCWLFPLPAWDQQSISGGRRIQVVSPWFQLTGQIWQYTHYIYEALYSLYC